jgi:hypothetical protein
MDGNTFTNSAGGGIGSNVGGSASSSTGASGSTSTGAGRRRRTGAAIAVVLTATAAVLGAVTGPATAHTGSGAHSPSAHSAGRRGDAVYLAAGLNGANEVPVAGGPAAGDKDGRALEFLKIKGDRVSFAIKWKGIAAPTAAHIHAGAAGTNGEVKIPLFAEKLPGSLRSVTGSVTVQDSKLLDALRTNPSDFYANLHTAEFTDGAVRAQLHKLTNPIDFGEALTNFQASVVRGKQIYACTKQADGSYAFTQHNVSALLAGGIRHSFVQPDVGPPQWVAPDRSAVTGKVLLKTPNGTGNIPELDLQATQSGRGHGLLADVQEVLRLNTVGGVAPSGTCDPKRTPTVGVPYRADYLFVQG